VKCSILTQHMSLCTIQARVQRSIEATGYRPEATYCMLLMICTIEKDLLHQWLKGYCERHELASGQVFDAREFSTRRGLP